MELTNRLPVKRIDAPPPAASLATPAERADFSALSDSMGGGFLEFVRYDAAQLTPYTREMFVNCDGRNADASNNPATRARLREFARKEVANNSYARGLTLIVASDTIGRGPRVNVDESVADAAEIEKSFLEWSNEINFAEKLRTARVAKMIDGETFGVFYKDKTLKHRSKFNVKFLESEQIGTPLSVAKYDDVDGIEINEYGDPVEYYVLKDHPGASNRTNGDDYVKIPASSIVHWYREDRPGQHRGVTEFAPALMMFYMLRRYTAATVDAAETAANFPIVIYTDSPALDGVMRNKTPFQPVHLRRNMPSALPEGWKLGQVKPEQPTTTYAEFKREILAEIARCFCVPVNVIAGDSSKHNYASGRLDYQIYHRSIEVERASCETRVLRKVFERWYEQTYLKGDPARPFDPKRWKADGRIPAARWFWDGFPHVDPAKEATAQYRRLASGVTTIAYEVAKQGIDPQRHYEALAKEREILKSLGIDVGYLKGKE